MAYSIQSIDLASYELGKQSARSMLLAGERFLISKMSRKGTDEEKFKEFYQKLPDPTQKVIEGYLKRQANLSLPQRVKVLGRFTDLNIEDRLTMNSSFEVVSRDTLLGKEFRDLKRQLGEYKRAPFRVVEKNAEEEEYIPKYKMLRFNLNSIRVNRAEDRGRFFDNLFGNEDVYLTDEISIGLVAIDHMGEVSSKTFHYPGVIEGRTLKLDTNLIEIDLTRGGDDLPKWISFQLIAIERDTNEQWHEVLDELTKLAKEKIDAELIAKGLTAGAAKISVKLPPEIAYIAASFLKGYVDSLIDWISSLGEEKDDVIGSKVIRWIHHEQYETDDDFPLPNMKKINSRYVGAGGDWTVTYSFELK